MALAARVTRRVPKSRDPAARENLKKIVAANYLYARSKEYGPALHEKAYQTYALTGALQEHNGLQTD